MARKKSYLKVSVQKVTPGRNRPDWSTSYLISSTGTAIYGAKDRRKEVEGLLGFNSRLFLGPGTKRDDQ